MGNYQKRGPILLWKTWLWWGYSFIQSMTHQRRSPTMHHAHAIFFDLVVSLPLQKTIQSFFPRKKSQPPSGNPPLWIQGDFWPKTIRKQKMSNIFPTPSILGHFNGVSSKTDQSLQKKLAYGCLFKTFPPSRQRWLRRCPSNWNIDARRKFCISFSNLFQQHHNQISSHNQISGHNHALYNKQFACQPDSGHNQISGHNLGTWTRYRDITRCWTIFICR